MFKCECACAENYNIEIELLGVPDKNHIELTVAEKSVCVTASGDDS